MPVLAQTSPTRWLLKRNCSASPRQLALVFASVVVLSCGFGIAFAVLGLWLVLPFVGLELLALALAFVCYGRHAADFERIDLAGAALTVERHEAGASRQWRLARDRARVELEQSGSGELGQARVYLAGSGERVEVGRHLPDARRRSLAGELRRALATASGGLET